MHQVILDRLEQYLSGTPGPREFTAHLETCEECRAEVREMQEVSVAFVALRAPEPTAAQPGFYARVAARLESQGPRSMWGFFWLDPAFGKRVAFASLMILAILGSYLITRETEYSAGPPSPEVIMAQQSPVQNADSMLATLASYEP